MRTSDVVELREEAGLATKLEDEASALRKRRLARPKFSMSGVQVVRLPRRRLPRPGRRGGRQPSLRIDFTSPAGQLSPAGMTRTTPSAPTSA